MFYQITFVDTDGYMQRIQETFETLSKARGFAKWMATRNYFLGIQIWRGGVGAELVA